MVAAFSVVEQMAELVEELDMRELANATHKQCGNGVKRRRRGTDLVLAEVR
jgi:hypothetical protein